MNFKRLYEDEDLESKINDILLSGDDFKEIIKKENIFEYHYFLSHLRHDLFNWYPFKKEGSLLEIGSGYGQLTGLFTKKVNRVVSIEDSESKAEIISKRAEDAEIIISDFNDIAIDEKFDYIVLCNIFEYAKSFQDSEHPYEDYLRYLRNFLKEDGVILIALSNRLGLKYFAGFKEEHTNLFFEGINGYNNVDYVETFSKTELKNLVESSGFNNYKFFYPYPDHEFPMIINTDELVNAIPFERRPDYFYNRYDFFREDVINQILAKDGLASYFSNSFLIEIRNSYNHFPSDDVYFVKLNSNRAKDFRTITTINSDGYVYKASLSPESNEHIFNMYFESKFKLGKINYLTCDLVDNAIKYKLLKEKSLEDYILEAILDDNREKFFSLIEEYIDALFYDSYLSDTYASDEFINIFKLKSNESFHCHEKSNIDLIFSNIFLIDGEYVAIDYEWIFDFEIPLEYIFYRVLLHHTKANKIFSEFITIEEIFDYFELDSSHFNLFRRWDAHFMQYVFDHFPKHNRNVIPKDELVESEYVLDYVNSYFNYDEYIEEDFEFFKKDIVINQRKVIDKKNRQINNLNNRVNNLNNKVNNLNSKANNLNNKVNNLNKQINNKNRQINQKNNQIKSKDNEISSLNSLIEEYQNSNSWKITKPLRVFRALFKKG